MERTKQTDLRSLFTRIDRRRLALSEHLWSGPAGLIEVATFVAGQPRSTLEILEHFGINRNDLALRLSAGSRSGILIEKPRAWSDGKGKIGRKPSLWMYCGEAARALARDTRAAAQLSAIDSLPGKLRDILDRWDFEAEDLTPQQAWRIAQFVSLIKHKFTITLADANKKLGMSRGYVRIAVSLAEEKGHLRVHRPERKGVAGRPSNDYEVLWKTFTPRADGSRRRLAPVRSLKQIADLAPSHDRRTKNQCRWCNAIFWLSTGLKRAQYWADAKTLFAALGESRITTYSALAIELGCGIQSLEKLMRRLRAVGLLKLVAPDGGRGNVKEWIPAWEKIKHLASEVAKPSRNSKATGTSQEPSVEGVAVTSMTPKKRFGPKNRRWESFSEWLARYVEKHPRATPNETKAAFLMDHPGAPLPTSHSLRSYLSRVRKSLKKPK